MRLEGKKALITGTAQGLGKEMALALAAEGCKVAGFDVRRDQLEETTAELRALGRQAIGLEVELRDFDAVQAAVAEVHQAMGGIDFLVNNAGKGQRQSFSDVTPEVWHYMMDVNLNSVFNVCHAVVPIMLEQGHGRIITISSIAALRGGRILGKSAYAAAKGGVIGFTKSLAFELAPHNITVNNIAPGVHSTPRRANDSEAESKLIMDNIPMKRLGEPADLAQTVVFLCLPSSGYITGVVLPQDGGHSI